MVDGPGFADAARPCKGRVPVPLAGWLLPHAAAFRDAQRPPLPVGQALGQAGRRSTAVATPIPISVSPPVRVSPVITRGRPIQPRSRSAKSA